MAPRASWKGSLKIADVTCAVGLYTAASTSDRVALHVINRATGHRVHRQYVDSETGKPVDREDQVKGYEVSDGDYIMLDPDEIAAVVPDSDKNLTVLSFVALSDIDEVYYDKPYFLAPSDSDAHEAFALIREGMRKQKVAAIAQTVLFRRVRTVLIRPDGEGLLATTLSFDYEVRSAEQAFEDIPQMKIDSEMRDLAQHIIKTKAGSFDPATFDDRYESALAELVKDKLEGRKVTPPPPPPRQTGGDLLAALRESAGAAAAPKSSAKASTGARKRQAG